MLERALGLQRLARRLAAEEWTWKSRAGKGNRSQGYLRGGAKTGCCQLDGGGAFSSGHM